MTTCPSVTVDTKQSSNPIGCSPIPGSELTSWMQKSAGIINPPTAFCFLSLNAEQYLARCKDVRMHLGTGEFCTSLHSFNHQPMPTQLSRQPIPRRLRDGWARECKHRDPERPRAA